MTKERKELARQIARDRYAMDFPAGIKRKRDPEQRAKQRAAQSRYEKEVRCLERRKIMYTVKRLANGYGTDETALNTVGCTKEEFIQHVRNTMVNSSARKFTLYYHVPLRQFNFKIPEQARQAMHFTNIYAKESGTLTSRMHTSLMSLTQARAIAKAL